MKIYYGRNLKFKTIPVEFLNENEFLNETLKTFYCRILIVNELLKIKWMALNFLLSFGS